jgi:tRNA uridine 5-carboxymethylaminomethyl modification enzyme
VLVDDLVTRGVSEPYRMFTSRAEYRLLLREDNADFRLTELGHRLGCVDDPRWDAFARKRDAVDREEQRLRATWAHPRDTDPVLAGAVLGGPLERDQTLFDLLKRPEVSHAKLNRLVPSSVAVLPDVAEQVEIRAKYAGYIVRQRDEIERMQEHEHLRLPEDLDYAQVRGLSKEVLQILSLARPETLGQAGRLQGVTPAAVSLLLVHMKKRRPREPRDERPAA